MSERESSGGQQPSGDAIRALKEAMHAWQLVSLGELIAAIEREMEELRAWKVSAMDVMNRLDSQAIASELSIPLGESIAEKILPAIRKLKTDLAASEARIKELEFQRMEHDPEWCDMRLAASEAAALREAAKVQCPWCARKIPFREGTMVHRDPAGYEPCRAQAILALITPAQATALEKVIQSAKREGREEMRKAACATVCVNCDTNTPLSDGKNGMHLGGLHCYAWAIRALPLDPEVPRP